jgi:SAM-dependent methyltransferase
MTEHAWNENYASGTLPWDTGRVESALADFVQSGAVAPGRALDIGAGRGTNARWLAERGFDVLGVDIAPLAVEQARERTTGAIAARCRFEARDFLADPPAGPFAFVFDRGCFHVFDNAADRERFAANVARVLAPGGVWLSLIGSTEGPAREMGPPRRSARDVADAIEPALAIEDLSAIFFDSDEPAPSAWRCVARKRTMPAQPSTQ